MKHGAKKLIVGQLVGQLALLAAIPVLTRLLPVAEMGWYQVAFSIATILQPVATLRRELLIPFCSDEAVAKHRTTGFVAASILVGLLTIAGVISTIVGFAGVGSVLISTGFVLASFALIYIENAILIRRARQTRLAARNLIGGLACAGLQIVIATIVPSAIAVAVALLAGRAIATLVTAYRQPAVESPREAESGAREGQRTFSAIASATIATASSQALVVLSAVVLGPVASAQIAVGQRIAGAPSSLIGQALTQIALGAAAPLIRKNQRGLTRQLGRQTVLTGAGAAAAAAALAILAPPLAVPVLGPGYELAGVLTAIFSVPLGLTMVALPATSLLIPLGYERSLAGLQALRLVSIVLAIVISSSVNSDVLIVCGTTSIVWSVAYVPLMIHAFRATRKHDRKAG